jgi:hypothetical protein
LFMVNASAARDRRASRDPSPAELISFRSQDAGTARTYGVLCRGLCAATLIRSGQDLEGIVMRRRLGVIVALGALLCLLGGVVTASPALAGRGHK